MINDKVAEIFEEASILLRRKSKIVWLKSSAMFFLPPDFANLGTKQTRDINLTNTQIGCAIQNFTFAYT